jgi:hypothetical protein
MNIFIYVFLGIIAVKCFCDIIKFFKTYKKNDQVRESLKVLMLATLGKVDLQNSKKNIDNIKKESDKKYMELQLSNKLNRDDRVKSIETETINKLIATGMSEQEAKDFIKNT